MKQNKRIKLNQSATALKTRDQVEATLRRISEMTIVLNQARLDMDERITAIKADYETIITDSTTALEKETELVRAWAEANPSEFKGKSAEFVHAIIGWRIGQPTLKTLAGWTWDRVLETVKKLGWLAYIRTKEEINRQQIIAERDAIAPEDLRKMGLRVVQEEGFFIEPKLSDLATKQQAAA